MNAEHQHDPAPARDVTTPPERGSNLARQAASGLLWVVGQNLVGRISLFVGQLVLARILLPTDFGVVALATTVSTISTTLVYFGIDQVLQQRRHTAYLWATQVFWISFLCGCIGSIVMVVLGLVGASAFQTKDPMSLIIVLALSTPFTVLTTVPTAALQWQLKFGFLSRYNATESVANQLLIVALALAGVGPLSFVIPALILAMIKAAVFWKVSRVRLRPLNRSKGWFLLMRRGMSALASRVSDAIIGQGDVVILGLFATTSVVGAYYFAFRLASQPMNVLGGSISNVLFSSLLKITDRSRQARVAFGAAELVGAITIPFCYLVAVAARPAVPLFFGAKWNMAIPIIQFLSIGMSFGAIRWPASAFLTSQGDFKRNFLYQTMLLPLFPISAFTGFRWGGAPGMAIGVGLYYFLQSLMFTALTFRNTVVGWLSPCLLFMRILAAATTSFGFTYLISGAFISDHHPIIQIAFLCVVAPLFYLLTLFMVGRTLFDKILHRVRTGLDPALSKLGLRWFRAA